MSCISKISEPVRKLIISILLLFLLVFLFTHVLCVRICHDQKLYPAVCDGDLLIALRMASPSEGDIVILPSAADQTAARYEKDSDTYAVKGVVVFLVRRRGF